LGSVDKEIALVVC